MEELRQWRAADAAAGSLATAGGEEDGEPGGGLLPIALPARKRRVIDVLQETLGAGGDSEEGGTDDEDEGLVLDWRQKGV
jgi:hypothetical protein